jgi:orotidine-5'-phosphate decarboxylase
MPLNGAATREDVRVSAGASRLPPRERLIVALDLPSVREAEAVVERLGDAVAFYKIGYQLAFAGGLPLAEQLVRAGKKVFLDLKLHDIANTVARGVESVAAMGMTFLSVHGFPQTMRAAVEARAGADLRLLAITALTSYDDADLAESGYRVTVEDLVGKRATQAQEIGIDGIVCSAAEAAPLRLLLGNDMALVTPGIRPAGIARGDQKRITTPSQAIAAGADYLVVGRPVVETGDPRASADAIIAEIARTAGV